MAPHKITVTKGEPTIIETSETESFSSEQSKKDGKHNGSSQTSPQTQQDEHPEESLDDLFSKLNQEIRSKSVKNSSEETEFAKIQASIAKLPKIESNLETKMAQQAKEAASKSHTDVVKINDPIVAKVKVSKDAPTDAGDKWFNMKQPEITPEMKRDLLIIKQRSALDPKRHYKKDKWEIPKYFQMGTIIEGNTEFYSGRMNRKQRGTSLVDEVLKDDDTNKYFKRKYSEIQQSKMSGRKGHYKKVQEKRRRF